MVDDVYTVRSLSCSVDPSAWSYTVWGPSCQLALNIKNLDVTSLINLIFLYQLAQARPQSSTLSSNRDAISTTALPHNATYYASISTVIGEEVIMHNGLLKRIAIKRTTLQRVSYHTDTDTYVDITVISLCIK